MSRESIETREQSVAVTERDIERIENKILQVEEGITLVGKTTTDLAGRTTINEGDIKRTIADIQSLRSSRHEHGNWLNRHNLEIRELQLQNKEAVDRRLTDLENVVPDIKNAVDKLTTAGVVRDKRDQWITVAASALGSIVGTVITGVAVAYLVLHFVGK